MTSNNGEMGEIAQTLWLLVTGIGILMMNVGFAMLESGHINPKNLRATMIKNISDNSAGVIVWVCFGYGLFGGDSPFAAGEGSTYLTTHEPKTYAHIFQQFGFACTATTLVSGAILGRLKFSVYLVLAMILTGIIYPIQAHWAWNPNGWLYKMGFLDFAGGMVAHGFGGCVGLVGAKLCGVRPGRFHLEHDDAGSKHSKSSKGSSRVSKLHACLVRNLLLCTKRRCKRCLPCVEIISGDSDTFRRVRDLPKTSDTMYMSGAWFLFVAWFSFNAGSAAMSTIEGAYTCARAALNTLIASGAGTIFGILFCYFLKTRFDVEVVVNSMLTSLVVATSSCGYTDLWVGIVAGPISVLTFTLFRYLVLHVAAIDDPLDVFAVHGAGGITGTVLLGFLHQTQGFFYTGEAYFLGVQVLGVVVIATFAFVTTGVFFLFAHVLVPNGFVYSEQEQLAGIDYLYFQLESKTDIDAINVMEYNVRKKYMAKRELRTPNSTGGHKHPLQDATGAHASEVVPARTIGEHGDVIPSARTIGELGDLEQGNINYN